MEIINKNIRFLRENASLTQKELAKRLNLKTPVIGSYEEGRSIPPIPTTIRIANLFNLTLDKLVLSELKELEKETDRGTRGKEVLSITVDSSGDENVELVTHKASAGYVKGYYDSEYIKDLPKISIPFLTKSNTYRAFEIVGDSMLPVKSGDIIIGKYLDNIQNLKTGKTYVFVSKSDGIVYKRVLEALGDNLLLISDNPIYNPFTMPFSDVLEIWGFVIRLTKEEEQPELPLVYFEKIMKIKADTDGATI